MTKYFFSIACCIASLSLLAQDEDSTWFVNNYTKIERQIPMRDGIKLFTSIYVPKDKTEKHPFLITRTPYSCAPYGEDKFMRLWTSYRIAYARESYIIVLQDVRGRYMSEGSFQEMTPHKEGKKPGELDSFLFDKYKIHTVGIVWENVSCVRVTPHVYTRLADLDKLVHAIEKIAASRKI